MERTQYFIKDREQRIKKREKAQKSILDKNKADAKTTKNIVNEEMKLSKKLNEERLKLVRDRKAKEKQMKIIAESNKDNNKLQESHKKLIDEKELINHNNMELEKLKEKETEILNNMQKTIETSKKIIDHIKGTPYFSTYYNNMAKQFIEGPNIFN